MAEEVRVRAKETGVVWTLPKSDADVLLAQRSESGDRLWERVREEDQK